ncbi:MAG: hypothetical protein ABI679_15670, partial [Gemmatimonadota bacterium]
MRLSIVSTGLFVLALGCTSEPAADPRNPSDTPARAPRPSYTIEDISTGPADDSYAWSINSASQVAGWSSTITGQRGWVWILRTVTWLPMPRGAIGSHAWGISSEGQIAGSILYSGSTSTAAFWATRSSSPRLIPTIGGSVNYALAVNASGRVAGMVMDATGARQAFVWEAGTGSFTLLGTLGGANSEAIDVNEAGTVTGCA